MDAFVAWIVRGWTVGVLLGVIVLGLARVSAAPPARHAPGAGRALPAHADPLRMPLPALLPPVPLGSIGDLIWEDDDWDGVRQSWEYGAIEVPVELARQDAHGGLQRYRITLTDWEGWYTFTDLPPAPIGCRPIWRGVHGIKAGFPPSPTPTARSTWYPVRRISMRPLGSVRRVRNPPHRWGHP